MADKHRASYTKIEHAWIVQQAAVASSWANYLFRLAALRPDDVALELWLATAPPRARTEAAVQVLTNRPATGTKGE